jgi:two-component system CheB/CheR fusion protein
VAAVAWYGGLGPSLLATALGYVAVDFFFLPPRLSLHLTEPPDPLRLSGYLILGCGIALFTQGMRTAQYRAEANAKEALLRQKALEREMAQRRRLEDELHQHAFLLADAARRKDEFLAMLSHELRNPLAPLKNAAQLLLVPKTPEDSLRWASEVIDRQVGQLSRLVDDLLDVSRISRGKIQLRKEPVELANILEQAVEISRPLLDARQHELTESLPAEPVWLEGDPVRLTQVIANLLNNAAKYTPQRGEIRVSAAKADAEVILRVRDNGVGIIPEMLSSIFEPFTQANRSLDRAEGGLGIGLTLARSLVEMHGGRIEAYSDGPEKGSEFVVRLAALRGIQERPSIANQVTQSIPSAPCRVLVVDDNRDAAESLSALLRVRGHEVCMAADGAAALEMATTMQPDVIFLDIGLPGMDGYELARRLREVPGLEGTLLIAVTGYGHDDDRRRSKEAGFDHHFVKPVDPAQLCSLLDGIPVA